MHRALEAEGRFREALAAIETGATPYRDLVADELATDRGRLLWRNARFDEAERVLVLDALCESGRTGDMLAEVATLLARPLTEPARASLIAFRDDAR